MLKKATMRAGANADARARGETSGSAGAGLRVREGLSARQGKAGEWGQPWRAFAMAMQRGEVPLHQRPHYARWVRQFVKTSPARLEARSPQELQAYLRELNERPHLKRWQVEQARAALVLMYEGGAED